MCSLNMLPEVLEHCLCVHTLLSKDAGARAVGNRRYHSVAAKLHCETSLANQHLKRESHDMA